MKGNKSDMEYWTIKLIFLVNLLVLVCLNFAIEIFCTNGKLDTSFLQKEENIGIRLYVHI